MARRNLAAMLDGLKARQIPVLLAGMQAAPNLGPAYGQAFDAIYPDLAKQYGAMLYPSSSMGSSATRASTSTTGCTPTPRASKPSPATCCRRSSASSTACPGGALMPRLFTALAVPPEIAAGLAAFRGGLPGARWVEPADFHVTLRFLGDVERTTAEDFLECLGEMRQRGPLTVTLEGLGAFGGGKPRALFAAIHPSPPISSTFRRSRSDSPAGRPRPGGPPIHPPHHPRPPAPGGEPGGGGDAPVAGARLPADLLRGRPVIVFSARDSTGGGPYVAEAEFPFG